MWPAVQTGLFVTAASHAALYGHSHHFENANVDLRRASLNYGVFSSVLDELKAAHMARSLRTHTQSIWTD